MNAIHYFINRWAALLIGIVLLSLPIGRWASVGSIGPMEIVVGGVGIGALLVAVDEFLREPARRRACPHCGEPLPVAA